MMSDESLSLFPNPVHDGIIFIKCKEGFTYGTDLILLNALGIIVATKHFVLSQKTLSLDVSKIPTGNYFVKVINGGSVEVKKIIVQ